MALRIAVIAGSFPPDLCGVGDYVARLAGALAARGHRVDVFTRAPRDAAGEPEGPRPPAGVEVHAEARGWGGAELDRLLARIAGHRPDVVHLQYQTALFEKRLAITGFPSRAARLLPGAATVVTLHDLNGPRILPRVAAAGRPAVRRLARAARGVVVTNELDGAEVARWGLAGGLRLLPVGPTIPVLPEAGAERNRMRHVLGLHEEETLFAYFGLIMRDKGIETLIEAAGLLPLTTRWKVLFIATPRNRREARWRDGFRRMAHELGIETRCIWRDRLPAAEVSRHLLAADVGVLPFREGLSTRRSSYAVMVAHGLPVVSTRAAKLPGTLGTGEPALLVEPAHPARLARAMRRLHEVAKDRAHYAARSRMAAGELSWETCALRTEEHYLELLGGGGRRAANAG